MNIKIINNAKEAIGIAVVIDVFRAFTVEPYLIKNGAEKLITVGDKQLAYDYKKKNNNCILIGERDGVMLPEFDYGNSPSQIKNVDFSGKIIIHTTSCGTQGIARSVNAKEIITGSLVNIKAIAKYIKNQNAEDVSLVCLCKSNETPFAEDVLCAQYIKSLLENKPFDIKEKIEELKTINNSGAKFFNEEKQDVFPRQDFYLCTELDKFDFIIRANKENDFYYMEKIEVKDKSTTDKDKIEEIRKDEDCIEI